MAGRSDDKNKIMKGGSGDKKTRKATVYPYGHPTQDQTLDPISANIRN